MLILVVNQLGQSFHCLVMCCMQTQPHIHVDLDLTLLEQPDNGAAG
jgi:hypothetical protein